MEFVPKVEKKRDERVKFFHDLLSSQAGEEMVEDRKTTDLPAVRE